MKYICKVDDDGVHLGQISKVVAAAILTRSAHDVVTAFLGSNAVLSVPP